MCVSACECVLIWALQVEQSANTKAPPAEGEEEEEEEEMGWGGGLGGEAGQVGGGWGDVM